MEYFNYLPELDEQKKRELFNSGTVDVNYYNVLKLSRYKLSLIENLKLGKQIEKISSDIERRANYIRINLGVVGDYTMEHLKYHMIAAAFRRGILLVIEFAPYDSLYPIALGKIQPFKNKLHYILAYSSKKIHEKEEVSITDTERETTFLLSQLYARYQAKVIINSCSQGLYSDTASINPANPACFSTFKDEYNAMCKKIVQNDSSILLLDMDKIFGIIGYEVSISPMDYYRSKVPFAYICADIFSDYLARLVAAHLGLRKKVVALDLDGTLWGGTLGDDESSNLVIGQGLAEGEAFYAFQKYIITQLYEKGIVLCIISKNNIESVKEAIRTNPGMFIKEEHFTMIQANWSDKATNLKLIAKSLNVGLDSIVFIDNSKYERDLMRKKLEDVITIEIGEDPSKYASLLANSGYFDYYSLNKEDMNRNSTYKNMIHSIEIKKNFKNYENYLKTLKMRLNIRSFEPINMMRIVQLINKTNQFNLMCSRMDQQKIDELMNDSTIHTIQISLEDKLENYGIISILVYQMINNTIYITTWVMSCRVFSRNIENAIIQHISKKAKQENVSRIIGMCKKVKQGGYVDGLYCKLGFSELKTEDEVTYYELNLGNYEEYNYIHYLEGECGEGNI